MRHHQCGRDAIAGHAARMPLHHIEPAVAESVLLTPVAGEPVAPMMVASCLRTMRERPARAGQAIAHVVVAAVADDSSNSPASSSACFRNAVLPVQT